MSPFPRQRSRRRAAPVVLCGVLALALMLAGPSSAATTYSKGNSSITNPCWFYSKTTDADWYFPEGTWRGMVWLQHGFGRANDALADLGGTLASDGYVVFSPTLGSLAPVCNINNTQRYLNTWDDLFRPQTAGGRELLRSARAAASPLGVEVRALPREFVFAGHSAGGSSATFVANDLREDPAAFANLRGVLLLDPVENSRNDMKSSLPGIVGERPVLTISSPGNSCNASASGTTALENARDSFAGVRLVTGNHTDAEGASTDLVGTAVCGVPKAINVQTLQYLARGWLNDWFSGGRDPSLYPGGTYLEQRRANGVLSELF